MSLRPSPAITVPSISEITDTASRLNLILRIGKEHTQAATAAGKHDLVNPDTRPLNRRRAEMRHNEGMTDEDIVVQILDDIKVYLGDHTAVMNYSLKKKGIIPEEYIMPASVKKLLKTAVNMNDSEIQLYKLDKMRGMYYFNGVENPQELYDEIFT